MHKYFKISLILLLTFMTFSLKAQIINIPDANFKNALIALGVDTNNDGEIQESEALAITSLHIEGKNIISLEGINYFKNLQLLSCDYNKISSINISNLAKLQLLTVESNLLTNFELSNLSELEFINCNSNQLTNFVFSNLPKLRELEFEWNDIVDIDLSNLHNLEYIRFPRNQITNIDLSKLPNLNYFNSDGNPITTLDFSKNSKLKDLSCVNNKIKSLDLSNLDLIGIQCYSNDELEVLYLKNGNINFVFPYLYRVPNLKYICIDSMEVDSLRKDAIRDGYQNIIINSYCNASSGGSFNRLMGQAKLDFDNNGCDEVDEAFPLLKIKVTNAIDTGYTISGIEGNFSINFQSETNTFEPILEHPEYYTVSPQSATYTFPDSTTPSFCITPNGVHNDLSVSLIPTTAARPGFSDATYKVVYKNQGTTTQSGSITFNYTENKMDFISSTPIADNTGEGNVSFDFSNLKPFETRSALITMRTNSPTDNPAVNSGDVLEFTATITRATDETPDDNLATLNQTVLGSFDPNDKTCLEGEIVSPALIGKNVHYLIRFENTGTANAENIVVTDYIDTTVFEISTLQIKDASHTCHTQISQGNKVQFIFSDIQLPFTEPDKHGYVAFSIKLKENLVIGDSIKNKADIFFDYNLPIETNIAAAEINYKTVTYIGKNQTLQGSLDIYPNPNNGQFTLDLKANIKTPVQISIMNTEGKTVFAKTLNHQNQSNLSLDLQHLAKGVYLIKAQVENDVLSKKVVIQ